MQNLQKVLVLAPHMDDEVIGCGGSLLKHKAVGRQLAVLYFTDGSHFAGDEMLASRLRAKRLSEANAVCSYMDMKPFFFNIPDRTLRDSADVLKKMIAVLHAYQPDIVYLPHENEGDTEHRLVKRLFDEACWLAAETFLLQYNQPMNTIAHILEYEVWTPIAKPSHYENIDMFIDEKHKVIQMYPSQTAICDYASAVKGLNQYRGTMNTSRLCYAEAFVLQRGSGCLFEKA